jgi:hypothetical protein
MPPHDRDATTEWLPPSKRRSFWPAVLLGAGCCLLVLCLGLPPLGWLIYHFADHPSPPAPTTSSAPTLPTLTVDELVRDFEKYKGRQVRFHGEGRCDFIHGPETNMIYVYFGSITCICHPSQTPDFAVGGEMTVEGFVTERDQRGTIYLQRCKRVFP